MAGGEAEDLRKQADVLDKIKETILSIYEKNSNLSRERLTALMNEETWLTGAEALEYGFATRLTEGLAVAAKATTGLVKNFKNVPNNLEMAEELKVEETTEEVTVEANLEEATEETLEETQEVTNEATEEEVEEVIEEKEEGILAKVKAFLSNKLENASNELNERYAEVSNEVKALKEVKADLESENKDLKETLEETFEMLKKSQELNESFKNEVKDLNEKLKEEVGEDLTPVVEPTIENKKETAKDVFRNLKK